MKKRLMGLMLLVGIMFALVGCNNEVQDDLLNYVNNETKGLEALEEEIIADYESVSGENFTDDYVMYDQINDVIIPKYLKFINRIEEIKPTTPEVQELHEIYIKAHNKQYNGMLKILGALESQDSGMVSEANQMLDEGRTGMREYISKTESLAKEYNLKLE